MPAVTHESRRTFSVHHCLGRGGFGEVYRAEMKVPGGLRTPVALKMLRRDVAPESQAVQRLRDEARLLGQLHHPNLLRVYDLTVLDGRVCLITEYVEGEDLSACLAAQEPLPLRALLQVVADVAAGLHSAYHTTVPGRSGPLRIVHRDVKPSNIRIAVTGEVKLLDFGIAYTDELSREARTGTDMMVGSPKYMAPERFLRAEALVASDVYSLGVILWEGLAGVRMFQVPFTVLASLALDETRFSTFMGERLEQVADRAPAAMLRLLSKMLAYDPAHRPTPLEVKHACEELQASLPDEPTLLSWSRTREWPHPTARVGDLDGRVLTEGGTLATAGLTHSGPAPRQPSTAPPSEVTSRPSWLAVALGAVLLAAASGGVWTILAGAEPAPVAGETAAVPAANSPPDTVPSPDALPPREIPKAPMPTARDVTAPDSDRSAPRVVEGASPAAVPARAVVRTPMARVLLEGGVPVMLVGADRRVPLRADVGVEQSVPAGLFAIEADFGMGSVETGRTVDLPPTEVTRIACSRRMQTCKVGTP